MTLNNCLKALFILTIIEPDDAPTNITLVGVDSTSLLAGWQLPTTPNGIVTHYTLYINYTNGSKIFIKVVESQFSLYLIEGLSPYQLVSVSISATTLGGEGPLSSTVYNTTHETGLLLIFCIQNVHPGKILVPGAVHNLTVLATSNTSVTVLWHPPLSINGIIIHYYVTLRKYDDTVIEEWVLEPCEDFQHNINGLGR